MSRDRVQGLAEANAMFDAIPNAAQQELVVELGLIGRDILAVQKRFAPMGVTGELRGALAIQVAVAALRLRVGLINRKLSPFYGRIVEFGRRAQTVLVQRRRRVNGQLRVARGRKRAEDIAATYALHVKARAPHPFVNIDVNVDLDTIATARLGNFWSKMFQRVGAA